MKDDAAYFDTIAHGRPDTPMPAWQAQGVTDTEINALIEFLRSPP
jgi:mono/diheme cytochrome c family protein